MLGVALEYNFNSLCLMHQQHNTPVLIWSNLISDLCETSRFQEFKLLQINIPSDVSDKHYSNDILKGDYWSILLFYVIL